MIINVLPLTIDLQALQYKMSKGRLVLADGSGFELDINEFGVRN